MAGALDGIVILDLTWSWAGPLATRLLADLGAEVIKIEGITRPDWTRFLYYADNEPGEIPWERGGFFHELNRNKRSFALDLASERGRELLRDLVAGADVLVESFTPRVKHGWGLDYGTLHERNPRLIMASMSGFGQDGPLRDYLAFGPTMEAMSGISALGGEPDGPPQRVGVMYGDPIMGLSAAAAITTAIYERATTGAGQYVDIAGTESCIAMIAEAFAYASVTGEEPPRPGPCDADAAFSGVFACEDGDLALSCPAPESVTRLAELLGIAGTPVNGLQTAVANATAALAATDLEARLQAAGIAAARVATSADMARDAHLEARGAHLRLPHPAVGERLTTGSPFPGSSVERARETMTAAPAFGADTFDVLRTRLGLSPDRIDALLADGVIALRPMVATHPGAAPIDLWRDEGLIRA